MTRSTSPSDELTQELDVQRRCTERSSAEAGPSQASLAQRAVQGIAGPHPSTPSTLSTRASISRHVPSMILHRILPGGFRLPRHLIRCLRVDGLFMAIGLGLGLLRRCGRQPRHSRRRDANQSKASFAFDGDSVRSLDPDSKHLGGPTTVRARGASYAGT